MSRATGSFLGLNRPEYVSAPELLVSSLAWSLVPGRGNPVAGLAYGTREVGSGTSIAGKPIVLTMPATDGGPLVDGLGQLLECDGPAARAAARLLASELEAVAADKSKRTTAVPLNLGLALMVNTAGVTGKRNPPNLAVILEQLNVLGGSCDSVAASWAGALRRAGTRGLPSWIEQLEPAFLHEVARDALASLENGTVDPAPADPRRPAWLHAAGPLQTPFEWFAGAWRSLCSSGWIDAMPRRRWTDWATCVARTALGAGFLFEMHLCRRMVSGLVAPAEPRDTVRSTLLGAKRLLRWNDRLNSAEADASPMIRELAEKGSACQKLLDGLVEDGWVEPPAAFDGDPDGLVTWLADCRRRTRKRAPELEGLVSEALGNKPSSAKNVHETILYSLSGRGDGSHSDLYGMLRRRGRYYRVDPGQEWLVAVASLAADRPGCPARLQDLLSALRQLGIEASMTTVVHRLEAYGLCRSSHDADEALEIQPAFPGGAP